MIDREHDLAIAKQAEALNISRGSVYYLPHSVSATDLEERDPFTLKRILHLRGSWRIRRR